ncbi:MAG: hypothetical protein ACRDTC_23685 [Pseudonocardiaceae bacterium]
MPEMLTPFYLVAFSGSLALLIRSSGELVTVLVALFSSDPLRGKQALKVLDRLRKNC